MGEGRAESFSSELRSPWATDSHISRRLTLHVRRISRYARSSRAAYPGGRALEVGHVARLLPRRSIHIRRGNWYSIKVRFGTFSIFAGAIWSCGGFSADRPYGRELRPRPHVVCSNPIRSQSQAEMQRIITICLSNSTGVSSIPIYSTPAPTFHDRAFR